MLPSPFFIFAATLIFIHFHRENFIFLIMRFIFFLILTLVATAVAALQTPKTINICGTVVSPVFPEVELLLLDDPLFLSEKKFLLAIQQGGTFSQDVPLAHACLAELKYGDVTQTLWLEPEQSLEMQFSGADFKKTLHLLGSGAAANLFLLKFHQKFSQLSQQIEQFMATASAEAYQKYILDISAQRRLFIENDPDFARATPPFQVFFSKNENYWTGYQLLRFAFDKPLFEGRWEPLVLPKSYYQFLEKMHISTSGLLQSADYQAFLDGFVEFQKIETENNGLLSIEVARKKLTGEALWLFEAREIVKTYKSGKTDAARQLLSDFKKICTLDWLLAPLEQKIGGVGLLPVGVPAPNFGLTAPDGKIWSLSEWHGKVVLLDFWATWCQPCVDALPKMMDLQAKLPTERVAVVFISLDKNPAAWRNFVASRGLGGIQLWGEPMQQSEIAKMFGVTALPTHFLIDQRGKIARAASGNVAPELILQHIQQLLNPQN